MYSLAVIFTDLQTHDGRRAIEIRAATPVHSPYGYAIFAEDTLYSCAYRTEPERELAMRRADNFLRQLQPHSVHIESAPAQMAFWQ